MTTNIYFRINTRQVLATFRGQSWKVIKIHVSGRIHIHLCSNMSTIFFCLFYKVECCLPLCTWKVHFGSSHVAKNISVSAASLVNVSIISNSIIGLIRNLPQFSRSSQYNNQRRNSGDALEWLCLVQIRSGRNMVGD